MPVNMIRTRKIIMCGDQHMSVLVLTANWMAMCVCVSVCLFAIKHTSTVSSYPMPFMGVCCVRG